MKRLSWILLAVVALGTAIQGCSSSSGRRVLNPAHANFSVDNRGPETISVYIDLSKIGEVRPAEVVHFDVGEGLKLIEYRETGGSVQSQGDWNFTSRNLLELKYRFTTTNNFQVTNLESEDLHVLIDGVQVGVVTPGQTLPMSVPVGNHDVSFRLRSDLIATTWGHLLFAGDNLVAITFND